MNAGGGLQQKSVAVVIWRVGWSGGLALEEVWGSVSPGNKHSPPCSERETDEHTPRISMRERCFLLARRVGILKHKAKPQSTALQGGVSDIFSNVCLQNSSMKDEVQTPTVFYR